MRVQRLLGLVSALALALLVRAGVAAEPIPIRVVVVTMFELGHDSGDDPGELQAWVERFPLPRTLPFPQGYRPLRYNAEKRVLGIVTGVGTAHSSASIMALGMDPRFDLRRTYWIVAGIAGADPKVMSLGSAAWAEWLVDGDLAHEIDAREIPDDWSTGYTPLDRDRPYQKPRPDTSGAVFRLDPGLVGWAYALTRDVELLDTPGLRRVRRLYADFPGARRPPFVLRGDNVASMTFWHGRLMTEWARRWLGYWTGGRGTFATTAQEDTGTALALRSLAAAGKVDPRRFLVLRTASNPSMQYPGISAAQSLADVDDGDYAGFEPSLDAAYRVGSPVVNEIVRHWSRFRDELPGAAPSRP